MQTSFISRAANSAVLLLGVISVVIGTLHVAIAQEANTSTLPKDSLTSNKTGQAIPPPTDIVGPEWSWTTITGTGYQNKTTGQLLSPSGMSAKFTFTKDGHYKKFFYIQQRTYDLVTQATTTESGTATFYDNGTVLLRPDQGHYLGNTGSKKIDRDMTAGELKPTTWSWVWRTQDGKRKLYIGPSTSSLKPFQRDK